MTNLGPLFILWLLSQSRDGGSGSGSGKTSFPTGTPITPTPPIVPAGYSGAAPEKWTPYHPLSQAVIARAQALLHDPTFTTELVEADPTHGQVRYLRTTPSPGHTSVTAWMPRTPAALAKPGVAV